MESLKNIGTRDRILRIILAIILFIIGFNNYVSIGWQYFFYLIALILIITSFIGWCGIYSMFGISSKKRSLGRITKKDIEDAIKEYERKEDIKPQIEMITPEKKTDKKIITKKASKKTSKKTTKKSTNKTATKKKTTKKITKKTSKKTSKKTTKKSTKKTTTKKSSR